MLCSEDAGKELDWYRGTKARTLCDVYESATFENVHRSWLAHLPQKPGSALDLGTGSGRDAGHITQPGVPSI